MKFIPYQRLTITTDLSKEEVLNRMQERVGPKRRENFVRIDRNIFSGQIREDKFRLTLNKDYRNSWTPEVIGGILETSKNRTELSVTLKSNSLVIAFTALAIIVGLIVFIYQIVNYDDAGDIDWSVLILVLVPYGLSWFGFNLDADKSVDGLIKITKGEVPTMCSLVNLYFKNYVLCVEQWRARFRQRCI